MAGGALGGGLQVGRSVLGRGRAEGLVDEVLCFFDVHIHLAAVGPQLQFLAEYDPLGYPLESIHLGEGGGREKDVHCFLEAGLAEEGDVPDSVDASF